MASDSVFIMFQIHMNYQFRRRVNIETPLEIQP